MSALRPEDILARIPQQPPFRFIDRILSVDEQTIVGEATFRPDASFYQGHFPGEPVTPGVILLEAMCQTSLVAFGIYLLSLEPPSTTQGRVLTLFTDASAVEFERMVPPGETVRIQGERLSWRRRKLQARATLTLANGEVAAKAVVSGLGVLRDA